MNGEIRDFVVDYFEEKGLPDFGTEVELLECNYLDEGIIDSLGIVELITAVESRFGIIFSPEEMQQKEFGAIGGLIGLVDVLLQEKGGGSE